MTGNPQKILDLLMSLGMSSETFDRVADSYVEQFPERGLGEDDIRLCAGVALEIELAYRRAANRPVSIESLRFVEYGDMTIEQRLHVREYNRALEEIWAATDEHTSSSALEAASQALAITNERISVTARSR